MRIDCGVAVGIDGYSGTFDLRRFGPKVNPRPPRPRGDMCTNFFFAPYRHFRLIARNNRATTVCYLYIAYIAIDTRQTTCTATLLSDPADQTRFQLTLTILK